jgi:hypothetical protein
MFYVNGFDFRSCIGGSMPVEVTWSPVVSNTVWVKFSGICGVQDIYDCISQAYALAGKVDFEVVLIMDFSGSTWKAENYLSTMGYLSTHTLANRKFTVGVGLSAVFKSLTKVAVRINPESVINYTVDTLDEAYELIQSKLSV